MVIHLPNEHIDPLLGYLRRGMTNESPTPSKDEADAIATLFQRIEIKKQGVPYRLWRSEHGAPESPSPETNK